MRYKSILIYIYFLITKSQCVEEKSYSEIKKCNLGPLVEEIASYKDVVRNIIKYTLNGPFKGKTYNELSKFLDKFGPRMSGTQTLEKSIDHIIDLTKEEMIYDVVTEYVEVPHWERGKEKLTMRQPRVKNMALLGLGQTVSTPPEGITAEVIVVSNFTTLEETPDEHIKGKIVLYNAQFTTYGETVKYRVHGATKASAKGAVAALVRSITPFSINSPHTGHQTYGDDVAKIPVAAITIEDADLIQRICDRGEKVELHLQMDSIHHNSEISKNILVNLPGTADTDKAVIISAHADSWDVGQGAMDDGGGLFITWAATVILKQLRLRPKRPIRAIYWTAEEFGLIGAQAYLNSRRNYTEDINFIMESDEGTFTPLGLAVGGTQEARCIIAEILKLFESINATTLIEEDSPGSDISVFTSIGVPGASLYNDNGKYFWFHHSEGDTINVLNPHDLDLCSGFWAALAYVIADLTVDIPR